MSPKRRSLVIKRKCDRNRFRWREVWAICRAGRRQLTLNVMSFLSARLHAENPAWLLFVTYVFIFGDGSSLISFRISLFFGGSGLWNVCLSYPFFFLFFSFFSSVWYSGLLIILLSRRSPINLGVFWIAVSIVVAKIASFITYWLSISVVVWWSAHCLPGLLLIDREKSSLRFSLFSFQSSEWAHWLLMRTNEWLWLDFHPDSPVICESSRIERYSLESRGIFSS